MITESSIKEELTYSDTSMFDEDFRHEQFFSGEFGRFISADEVRENYQVGFTPAYMLKLTLGGLFTSTLATIISSYYIFILSPRKILLQ